MKKVMTLGDVAFNCTHPMGVENCPIHKDNPNAGLHDCRYKLPFMYDEETNTGGYQEPQKRDKL